MSDYYHVIVYKKYRQRFKPETVEAIKKLGEVTEVKHFNRAFEPVDECSCLIVADWDTCDESALLQSEIESVLYENGEKGYSIMRMNELGFKSVEEVGK